MDQEIQNREQMQKDIDALMRKYDRESNTRIWKGRPGLVVKGIMILFSLWCIYVTLFATFLEEIRLTSFLGVIILMGFLLYPAKKSLKMKANTMPPGDILFMVIGSGAFFYYAAQAEKIVNQGTHFTWLQIGIGIIGLAALIEVTRRCVGLPILIVAGFFMIYALSVGLTNPSFPGRVRYLVRNLFYTKEGIFSTPVNVCSKFIVVFIIFGAFLERTGISNFFISLANCIAGRFAGGPAKVAVISSALCGMVSGSSVGNTVTTGAVTIPMMKKTGYRPEFAGAVEAAASTGGQIMPPIMGAAAFLMADFIGVPYSDIIGRAILPAVLYFGGIFISVHLEAKKLGLSGIPKEELPKFSKLIRKAYLLIPLVALVVWVSGNYMTMQQRCGGNHLRLHHDDRACQRPDQCHCGTGRRAADRGAVFDDALLHCAGNGGSHHGKLLHYGSDDRTDSHSDERASDGSAFLCFLFRNCGGHHAAGGACRLCRQCHRQEQSDEDSLQCIQTGDRRLHCAVHFLLQSCDVVNRNDSAGGHPDCSDLLYRYFCGRSGTGRLLLCENPAFDASSAGSRGTDADLPGGSDRPGRVGTGCRQPGPTVLDGKKAKTTGGEKCLIGRYR